MSRDPAFVINYEEAPFEMGSLPYLDKQRVDVGDQKSGA